MNYFQKLPNSVREAPVFPAGRDGHPNRQTHQERGYPGDRNCSDSVDDCSDGCHRLFCGDDDEGARLRR